MSLVAYSLFNVKRLRSELEKAFLARHWSSVCDLDVRIQSALDVASADELCDKGALLKELEVIVGLYRQLTLFCRHQGIELKNFPSP